jgi:hypothetical protein
VILIGIAFLSLWTFRFTLQPRQDRRAQSVSLLSSIQLPGRFGGLLKKDLRYLSRLLDVYLTLPVVVLFNTCTSIVFNSFGLDEPLGLDRYALFPLSAKEKLAGKNIAFAVVMAALFATILPLALLKMETWVVLVGCVELVLVGLAYASYGNCLSVKLPFKMQFYRFASGGSAVDAVMGMIFGSVPAAALIYLLYRQSFVVVSIVLLLAIDVAIYVLSLRWAARVFDDDREVIRHALS